MQEFPQIKIENGYEDIRDATIKAIRETYAPLGITLEVHKAIFAGIFYSSMQALDAMFILAEKDRAEVKALQKEIIEKIDDLLERSF